MGLESERGMMVGEVFLEPLYGQCVIFEKARHISRFLAEFSARDTCLNGENVRHEPSHRWAPVTAGIRVVDWTRVRLLGSDEGSIDVELWTFQYGFRHNRRRFHN